MLIKRLTSAAVAAALICVPATRASADTKDAIIGAIIGGAVIGGVLTAQKRKAQREAAAQQQIQQQQRAHKPRVSTRSSAPKARRTVRAAPKAAPRIPATQEGREIQSALNYFGFSAGTVDGQIGRQTRSAVSGYQAYMGYPATGKLSAFEQHVLTQTYLRAEAGGTQTFRDIAQLPEGTRGLLKLYRAELAGHTPAPTLRPSLLPSSLPGDAVIDL